MAGRGRGATLPAWMTAPGGPTMATVAADSSAWAASTASATIESMTIASPPISIPPTVSSAAVATNLSPPAPRGPPPLQNIQNNPPLHALSNNIPLNLPPFAAPPIYNPPPQQPEHMMQNLPQNHGIPPQSMGGGPSMMPPFAGMGHMHGMGHMSGMGQMPGMHGMMFPPPGGMPGMPNMQMPMTGRLPMSQPHQQYPMGGQLSSSSSANNSGTALDPNNDVSCWSEHTNESEDRKYWYNKATLVSTYEKPFCLKTPEERSIPPCPWKEYAAPPDGSGIKKKYYSNGTDSTWTMPEEFRIWKEKIDAIEAKKKQVVDHGHSKSHQHHHAAAASSAAAGVSAEGSSNTTTNTEKSRKQREKEIEEAAAPQIVYASHAEAVEAFHELLNNKKVSANAKMKEVMDLCQSDPRWDSLKILSQGDKKQGLAEYQTKKLKQEKDIQKQKARKHRDAFLLMLAENTDIDARTRWRDAIEILQDDQRYKNVDDSREREDMFRDFCLELEKKEKDDRRKQRDAALEFFQNVLKERHATGGFSWRAVWADSKKDFVDVICKPELKGLEDSDLRRCFQDFCSQLEEQFRKEEKRKKEEFQKLVESRQSVFSTLLDSLVKQGLINPETRWKEISLQPVIAESEAYKELCAAYQSSDDTAAAGADAAANSSCRDIFEKCLQRVQESYRTDRRLLRDILDDCKLRVAHDSTLEWLRVNLLRLCKDYGRDSISVTDRELLDRELEAAVAAVTAQTSRDSSKASVEVAKKEDDEKEKPVVSSGGTVAIEEGEEVDDNPPPRGSGGRPFLTSAVLSGSLHNATHLRKLLLERNATLVALFKEMKAKALTEYEEQQRMIRKMEGKFLTLLEDHFYLSDHIGIQWEDAKKTLQKRSAYDAVGKSDRKRLFQKHMENLAAKMEAKTKSMKLLIDSRDHSSSNTEHAPPVGDGHSEQGPVVVPDGVAANKDSSTEALYDIEKEMQEDSDSDKEKEKGRDKDRDKHSKKDKDKEKDKDKDKHKKDKKHKKHSKRERSPSTGGGGGAGEAKTAEDHDAARKRLRSDSN